MRASSHSSRETTGWFLIPLLSLPMLSPFAGRHLPALMRLDREAEYSASLQPHGAAWENFLVEFSVT
jgi:hypothetical protein